MESKRIFPFLGAFLIIIGFSSGYVLGQSPMAPINVFATAPDEEALTPFWETWELIQSDYYNQPLDDVLLAEGAIEGMLAALDDNYTRYLPPLDQAAAEQNMSGEMEGIGAEVTEVDGDITIVSPIDGSPAEAADLQPGDILREANGVVLTGMSVFDAAALVRGPAGTVVKLLIERDGDQFELEITRAAFQIKSVDGEMLENNIAYIRLSQFGNQTPLELSETLTMLLAQNPQGLILDLRRNPGGLLSTAVNVADQFLPEGVVLTEEFGDGRTEIFESSDKGLAEDIPLVVLIDEGSASASEVLAGAIRAQERGILIGQTSFGKGTVQTWRGLSNDGGVRITVARWLMPDDTWINEVGIEPDYVVAFPEDPDPEIGDIQLEAAINYLLGEPVLSNGP